MAFGQHTDDEEQMMAEINMTPFVDVMLVLLIIFIIAMPVITQSIIVELPKATLTEHTDTPPKEPIQLVIQEDGSVMWQSQVIDTNELKQKFNSLAAQVPQPQISLHGAAKVPYQDVIHVMALAQQAGVESLNFATQLP